MRTRTATTATLPMSFARSPRRNRFVGEASRNENRVADEIALRFPPAARLRLQRAFHQAASPLANRLDRQTIVNLMIRSMIYLTFGMAVSSVWSGGGAVISFIYTYVLPIYQSM